MSTGCILDEVKERVDAGFKEITLTGVKIGSWRDNREGSRGLKYLTERILSGTGIERLRLSSLQPQDLQEGLLGLWNDRRLCRHLHIPLQSGCGRVLERMGRRYSIEGYERAVSLAREAIPGVSVTTDIVVGFPGESEEDFEEGYDFCRRMRFARVHVFPYSPRPGTAAAEMSGQVGDRAKRERVDRMLKLAQESAHEFREQLLGQTVLVLWEGRTGDGLWTGLTDNYVRLFAESGESLTNQLLRTRVMSETMAGVGGVILG